MSGSACILCQSPLKETTAEGIFLHIRADDSCKVELTDPYGVSVDDRYELVAGTIYERGDDPPPDPDVLIAFEQFTRMEVVVEALFDRYSTPRLGGASGDFGWSSFSAFQRCPYLWYRTYVVPHQRGRERHDFVGEPLGMAVGTVAHTFLAIHYMRMGAPRYPITPEIAREFMLANGANPEAVNEGWRIFVPYRLYYRNDPIKVLAVEYHIVDPRTRESSRFDLICEFTESIMDRPAGVYAMDHKTAQRFDQDTLFGWVNDGTILQQITLWERLGLEKKFGQLQGMIVNLLGKQKEPKYHRTWVPPNRWQTDQQASDLKMWKGLRQICIASGTFPRARNNCIGKYGRCSQFDHCATGEDNV